MSKNSTKNIKTAFFLNLFFFIIEIIGGIFANSMSIITDAIHDCSDTISFAISWILEKKSEKRPNKIYTYGYMRFSVLGALINSLVLLIGSCIMLYEAIPRIFQPEKIDHNGMLILAIIGLFVNGIGAYKTAKGGSISEKAVSLHLLEDVLVWISILTVSVLIKLFDAAILDPILSICITAFILFNVFKNLKHIFEILMEKAPTKIDPENLKRDLMKNENIINVHHIHLWFADGINIYSTMHIVIKDNLSEIKISQIKKFVKDKLMSYKIGHVTIEIEFECERCKEDDCEFETKEHFKSDKHHY